MRRSASTASERGTRLNALLLIGSIRLLGSMIIFSKISQSAALTGWHSLLAYMASKLGLEQSDRYLPGIPIPNLFHGMLPSASLNHSLPHMARKRTPAWCCGDTFLFSRPGCNHPENGGAASEPQPDPAQPSGACGMSERRESMRLVRAKRDQNSLILLGLTILLYQIVRDQAPLWERLEWLLVSMLGALLLMLLNSLWEFLRDTFS